MCMCRFTGRAGSGPVSALTVLCVVGQTVNHSVSHSSSASSHLSEKNMNFCLHLHILLINIFHVSILLLPLLNYHLFLFSLLFYTSSFNSIAPFLVFMATNVPHFFSFLHITIIIVMMSYHNLPSGCRCNKLNYT